MRKNRTAGGTLRVLCALLTLLMACAAAAEEASPVDSLDMILGAMDAASRFWPDACGREPPGALTDPALPRPGERRRRSRITSGLWALFLPKDPGDGSV